MSPESPPTLPYALDDAETWATAKDVEYFSVTDEFRILWSREHDVLFIDPLPKHRLNEIYPPSYYSFADPSGSALQRIKARLDRRLFRTLLREIPGQSLSALDVGGGAGWMLDEVRAVDSRIVRTMVVDIDPQPAVQAETSGHEYFCGRIEDLQTTERFDLVLLLNLIEHVEAPLLVLQGLAAKLTDHGRILVKTPNWDSLDARLFRHRNWAGYHCPRHWVLFTRDSFERLVQAAGLRVLDFKYTQGAPFWAASVLNWLRERALVRIDRERPAVRHPLYGPLNAAFAAFDFIRLPFAKTSQMFFVLAKDS